MYRIRVLALLFSIICAGCIGVTSAQLPNGYLIPSMPDITPDMNTAGFWISRAESPDKVIMSPDEIKNFNALIAKDSHTVAVSDYDDNVSGEFINKSIQALYTYISARTLYDASLHVISHEDIHGVMSGYFLKTPDNNTLYPIRFGIITENTHQRVLPTSRVMGREADSGRFDRIQMAALYIGTPAAILWEAGGWYYVRTPVTVGWVSKGSLALCSREEARRWEYPAEPYVVTDYKASVYADSAMRQYITWLPLGAVLLATDTGEVGVALLPSADADGMLRYDLVHMDTKSVHKGYLPYTSANMIELAFRMLHAPYGWGGMFGEQDCSGLVRQVFGAVGINMPRNSVVQGQIGEPIYSKKKYPNIPPRQALVFFGIPGASLIQFPGHIMLYIGKINGEPYVIHSLWSFDDYSAGAPVQRIPARVAVSNMRLGSHSKSGSYIDRASNIRNIKFAERGAWKAPVDITIDKSQNEMILN